MDVFKCFTNYKCSAKKIEQIKELRFLEQGCMVVIVNRIVIGTGSVADKPKSLPAAPASLVGSSCSTSWPSPCGNMEWLRRKAKESIPTKP